MACQTSKACAVRRAPCVVPTHQPLQGVVSFAWLQIMSSLSYVTCAHAGVSSARLGRAGGAHAGMRQHHDHALPLLPHRVSLCFLCVGVFLCVSSYRPPLFPLPIAPHSKRYQGESAAAARGEAEPKVPGPAPDSVAAIAVATPAVTSVIVDTIT